jgi:D-psicose/D-tagatose/L-ribulose 3-epimerase
MNVEEDDFEAAIVNTGDKLGHFHVGEGNRKPPGTGRIEWDTVFAALKKIDYQGWIVMEPFVLSGGDIALDVALFRELMPDADLDEEAKKALDFIKGKMRS